MSWNRIARGSFCLLAVISSLPGLVSLSSGQEPTDSDPPAEKLPGRIYLTVFRVIRPSQPPDDEGQFAHEVIAIDPNNGTCETIVQDAFSPRVSPDGQRILYLAAGAAGPPQIWIKKLGSDDPPRVVCDGDKAFWTHDSERLVVLQLSRSPETKQVLRSPENRRFMTTHLLIKTDGTIATKLAIDHFDHVFDCDLSSPGLLVINPIKEELYTLGLDGSGRSSLGLGPGQSHLARLSPNGKQLAYLHRRPLFMGVRVADIDGKNMQTAFDADGLTLPQSVCWAPDGEHLAVVLSDWKLDANGHKVQPPGLDHYYRIVVMCPDGTQPRELHLDGVRVRTMWEPDWR